jgi:hypothetical protein
MTLDSLCFSQAKNLSNNQNIGYKGVPVGFASGTTFSYQPSNMNQNLAKAPAKILIFLTQSYNLYFLNWHLKELLTVMHKHIMRME